MPRLDEQPVAFCEACGAPFYDGDEFGYDADQDVAVCLAPPPSFLPNFPVPPCYEGRAR